MKTVWIVTIVAIILIIMGCNRGSVKLSPVFEGEIAPHAGWNFGPDSYVQTGDQIKVSGVVFWIEGTDPNTLFGE